LNKVLIGNPGAEFFRTGGVMDKQLQEWAHAVFEWKARMQEWEDMREPASAYAVNLMGNLPREDGESEEAWEARGEALAVVDPEWEALVAPSDAYWAEWVLPALLHKEEMRTALISALMETRGITEPQARVLVDKLQRLGDRWALGLQLSRLDAPQVILEKQARMVGHSLMCLLEAV
jgi:hypothetical protein